jgi:hypothetical protein
MCIRLIKKTKTFKVLTLLPSGLNDVTISRYAGCSREFVRQMRVKYGFPKERKIRPQSIFDNEKVVYEIIKMHREGYTQKQIVEKLGISIFIIVQVAKVFALKFKNNGRSKRRIILDKIRKIQESEEYKEHGTLIGDESIHSNSL